MLDLGLFGFVVIGLFVGIPAGLLTVFIVRIFKIKNICKLQEKVNSNLDNFLKTANFVTTNKLLLNDIATWDKEESICKKHILIDNKNKQFCLVDYEKEDMFIFDFDEFLDYEIYENESKRTTGQSIGGNKHSSFTAETNDVCKDLKLIIRLNRYDKPQICYKIIYDFCNMGSGTDKSSFVYKECISTLQEAISFLEIIKNENTPKTANTSLKTKTIFCPYCGKKNSYDADTCKHCGAPIK